MSDSGSTSGWDGAAGPPPPRYPVAPPPASSPPAYVPGPPIGAPPAAAVPPFAPFAPFGPGSAVAPAPQGPAPGVTAGIMSIVAAIVLVPAIALLAVLGLLAVAPSGGDRDPAPVPVASPSDDPAQPDPAQPDPAQPDPGRPDPGQPDPGQPDPGQVEATLQRMIDDYKLARRDGSLWERIPDTEFNQTAVTAFLYLITDLKLAASFGADTSDYLERADELERRLLAEEPLGTDISITLSDRTFTYDGETGAGGFTDT